jgi:hypothetical protein
MGKQWLDYVKHFREEHPELSYKQALQDASAPFHKYKRALAMHGGIDGTPWQYPWTWLFYIRLIFCIFNALSAGGLFVRDRVEDARRARDVARRVFDPPAVRRVEDAARRAAGHPAIDRAGTIYFLPDDTRSAMIKLLKSLFYLMLAYSMSQNEHTRHEQILTFGELSARIRATLTQRESDVAELNRLYGIHKGGEVIRRSRSPSKGHFLAVQSKSNVPSATHPTVADVTRAIIALIGDYRTVHEETKKNALKNHSVERQLEELIIDVQTSLSKHLENVLSMAGDAMTVEHMLDAFGHSLPTHADDGPDFDQLTRHAYYGEFSHFMRRNVVPQLEAYAMDHQLASGTEIRELMDWSFPT